MQRRGKHSSTTIKVVFCVVSAEVIWRQFQTEQISVVSDSDRVQLGSWMTKQKWQEDFIVFWSASFCVEIGCQETTSEDGGP
jgi:hypothetical protein